jgi:hypothetical protein
LKDNARVYISVYVFLMLVKSGQVHAPGHFFFEIKISRYSFDRGLSGDYYEGDGGQ